MGCPNLPPICRQPHPPCTFLVKTNGSPLPIFETDDDRTYFLTILPLHPFLLAEESAEKKVGNETRGKTRGKTIELMQADPCVSVPRIAELLGLTEKGVEYHIARMKEDKIVRREGGRKEGTWKVLP